MTNAPAQSHQPRRRASRNAGALTRALAASLVLVAASFAIAGPAHAQDSVRINFEPTGSEIEYGTSWDFAIQTFNTLCERGKTCKNSLEVTITGANGYSKRIKRDIPHNGRVYISQYDFGGMMAAGTYTVTAKFNDPSPDSVTGPAASSAANKPAKLVIAPAQLTVDFRIETDENQPSGAIANAQLAGAFVQGIEDCYGYPDCHLPVPAGEWAFTITDDAGATVSEKKVTVKGGATQFASFYWHDVPAASNFSASATFTPVSAEAGNFAITPEKQLLFTSPDAPVVDNSGPAVVAPVAEEPEAPSTVPLWLVILGLGLLVLLLVAVAIFFILLRRQATLTATVAELDSLAEGGNE